MTDETNANPPAAGSAQPQLKLQSQRPALFRLPGVFAIGLYMILLAIVVVIYVVQGRVGPVFLVFPVLFIAAGLGLMLLLRWAWALTLAAVVLLAGGFFWTFATRHLPYFLMQGLLNLVFFLYLARTAVRSKLR